MQSITSQSVTNEAADQLYNQRQYAEAAEAYAQILSTSPTSAHALKGRGLSLLMLGNTSEGVASCSQASSVSPTDPEMRYAYGYALGTAGQYEAAIPELDATLNLQPNHNAARQALVYCLIQCSRQTADTEPDRAVAFMDRAHKLDRNNPDTIAAAFTLYFHINQPRKVLKVVETLSGDERSHPTVRPFVERLLQDPAMAMSLRSSDSVAAPAPKPAQPAQTMQQVPCPKCALPIMSFAAICPHCGHQNRPVGSFQGRNTGPDHTWQEIAFVIMAILYTVMGIVELLPVILARNSLHGFEGYYGFVGLVDFCVGLGLLFRQEWIGFIAKIMCYKSMLFGTIFMLVTFFGAHYLQALGWLVQASVAGFMVYLINYEMD